MRDTMFIGAVAHPVAFCGCHAFRVQVLHTKTEVQQVLFAVSPQVGELFLEQEVGDCKLKAQSKGTWGLLPAYTPCLLDRRVDMATLFEPTASPRVYGLPPGVDFPKALLAGLRERLHGQPPEALARIHLVVNSQRMKRRLGQLLHSATPCLLPPRSLPCDASCSWVNSTAKKHVLPFFLSECPQEMFRAMGFSTGLPRRLL